MYFVAIDVLILRYIIPFETSLSISWGLGPGVTPTSYSISYHNTNIQCFSDSHDISDIDIDQTMYYLTGLEEGSEYSVAISVRVCESDEITEEMVITSTLPTGQYRYTFQSTFSNQYLSCSIYSSTLISQGDSEELY